MMTYRMEQATAIIETLVSYFETGNSIPVDRVVIRADSELIEKAREFVRWKRCQDALDEIVKIDQELGLYD